MTNSVELQVISRILTTQSPEEIDKLLAFDDSYYSVFKKHIQFILDHRSKYGDVPDVFTFQAEFEDFPLIQVKEPILYLENEMRKNKQRILLLDTFNTLSDLGSADVSEAWEYLYNQCEKAQKLDAYSPMDIVKDAIKRSEEILEFNRQKRIPTGFPEIDKLMYGGLSTVEEFLVIIARTNTGKSWVCTKMMESAQSHGFPVLYYSPEMQASFIGTRFDTWRGHFRNSDLYRGQYTEEYKQYLKKLVTEEIGAIVVEDKDMPDGRTTVRSLEQLVKRNSIKLLIIDGMSYIADSKPAPNDSIRYKNIGNDLFRLSKSNGCAVVMAAQANRETKENKDDKGDPFPTIYNLESSDHPARIATQVFSLRQIFDKHILDIRMEKSRTAKNDKPVFSYVWDPNTGTTELVSDDASAVPSGPSMATPMITTNISTHTNDVPFDLDDDDDDYSDVEF